MKAWCHGSRRAVPVPASERWDDTRHANCTVCGLRLEFKGGTLPKHRRRGCLVAGCESPQTGGGLCEHHNREIVGVP